ncbi:MAG: hypothetical protein R3B70_07050 [Polyangiaceae bacterium]
MKTKLALFLGTLLALSVAGCDGDGNGTGGTGGAGGETGGSGGSTGGTGGSTGGTGGTGTTSNALSCDDYCAAVATNCTADQSQYGDDAACKAICAKFPIGTVDEQSGNSLGCRTYHGGTPAAGDPGTHCPHAGPLGGGVCGNDCDNFCDLVDALCSGQASPPYTSKTECMTACAAFPGTGTVPYNSTVTSGNSLACRMYHLTVGSTSASNLETHCPHTAAVSATCN